MTTKYEELTHKYSKYFELVSRVDWLVFGGRHPNDVLPDAYAWIEKHIDVEDRPEARKSLERLCRMRGGYMGKTGEMLGIFHE